MKKGCIATVNHSFQLSVLPRCARIYFYTRTDYDIGERSQKETENTPKWINLSTVM